MRRVTDHEHGGKDSFKPYWGAGTLGRMPGEIGGRFEKGLRVGEGRRVKRLEEQAAYIATLEPDVQKLSDADLRGKTAEFRQRLGNGEPLGGGLFRAFAAGRGGRVRASQHG